MASPALLAFIAGSSGKVYSLDRIQWMWEKARKLVNTNYPNLTNLEILFRDGRDGLADKATFDGILFSFIPDNIDEVILDQLSVYGRVLAPTSEYSFRIIEKDINGDFTEEIIPNINTSLLNKAKSGLS